MRYVELLNSIPIIIIRVYKNQIIRYYCDKCSTITSLICQDIDVCNHAWVCDNCGEDISNMLSIESRLEEIFEEIRESIREEIYFNEVDEDDENVKVALKIINYVNEYISKEKQNA